MTTIDMDNTDMWVGVDPDGEVPYLFFGDGTPTSVLDQGTLYDDQDAVDLRADEWSPEMAIYDISYFTPDQKRSVLYGYGTGEGLYEDLPTTSEVFIHTPLERYFLEMVDDDTDYGIEL